MTYGSRKQTFNQAFSARIASACKRIQSQRAKLAETDQMLREFLSKNHPLNYIPPEFTPELKEIAIAIDQLKITEQALRDFNKGKTCV